LRASASFWSAQAVGDILERGDHGGAMGRHRLIQHRTRRALGMEQRKPVEHRVRRLEGPARLQNRVCG
jgi:hypothetical protein